MIINKKQKRVLPKISIDGSKRGPSKNSTMVNATAVLEKKNERMETLVGTSSFMKGVTGRDLNKVSQSSMSQTSGNEEYNFRQFQDLVYRIEQLSNDEQESEPDKNDPEYVDS